MYGINDQAPAELTSYTTDHTTATDSNVNIAPVQCSRAISSNDSPWCVEWWPGNMWTATVSCAQAGPLYPAACAPSLSGGLCTTYKPSPMTESKSGEAVCVLPHLSGPKGHPGVCGRNSSMRNLVVDWKVWHHVIQLLATIHALFAAISINYISNLHSVGATRIEGKSVLTPFDSNLIDKTFTFKSTFIEVLFIYLNSFFYHWLTVSLGYNSSLCACKWALNCFSRVWLQPTTSEKWSVCGHWFIFKWKTRPFFHAVISVWDQTPLPLSAGAAQHWNCQTTINTPHTPNLFKTTSPPPLFTFTHKALVLVLPDS